MYRIGEEEVEAVRRVIASKKLFKVNVALKESMHVEEDMREYFKSPYAILMTSGHAALVSSLTALGVGPGDQVIVPAYTYIATAMAVVAVGAIPVIAEVDETLTISPEDVERKITPATKVILPVHICGYPCNMDALLDIAKRHNLYIVEDACQADGGTYHGQHLGTIGDTGVLSFNHFKVITAGEGGGFFAKDRGVYERALIYHDSNAIAFFGNQLESIETTPFCGGEFRTNEITSAILRVQLRRLDGIIADLRKNRSYIKDAVADLATFIPSNDESGDISTNLTFIFNSKAEAEAFAEAAKASLPARSDRHIYNSWTPILEKRGAIHPLMDPFKMEANRDIIPDYSADMCPNTLDLLSRVATVGISPDFTKEEMDEKIALIRAALTK